jgi:hypothetical protein
VSDDLADLAAYLLVRLDEEQREAERMRDAVWPETVAVVPSDDTGPPAEGEPMGSVSVEPQYTKRYGRVWNPAQATGLNFDDGWRVHESAIVVWSREMAERRLAKIEARRRIVELHGSGSDPCDAHGPDLRSIPCDTLRALAQQFAGRDDFREEWRL